MELQPHRDTQSASVRSVEVAVWHSGERWHFRYVVEGAHELLLPVAGNPGRTDLLWKNTCFEAFVGLSGGTYLEFNFAPSGQWAAYGFEAHRQGMCPQPAEVDVRLDGGESWIAVEAAVTSSALCPGAPLGLTAVIEETGSRKSYWALAHPAGPPDFHDPSCFIAKLPE